jgi:hypothetical protein
MELEQRLAMCCSVADGLAIVYQNGDVTFGSLSFTTENQEFARSCGVRNIGDVKTAEISQIGNGIAVYRGAVLTVLTLSGIVRRDRLYLKCCRFSGSICQVSDTEFRRCSHDGRSVALSSFAVLPARILCFASSDVFKITVAGCDDGKLRIRSNWSGRKVATIGLDGEIAVKVLITRSWGMIVVKTIASIFVFDVNGFPVQKVANSSEFVVSASFDTRDGFDFVVFQDSDQKSYWFEAANPSAMTLLESVPLGLVCIDYDKGWDRFLFVSDTGKVLLISRSIA